MLVEMRGITKDFGPVCAVDNVDFSVGPGRIIGLLGENGAGKSTLMNVLAGSYPATSGDIFINGQKVRLANAKAASQHGIRFIHQELNLCNDLAVFENMFLADEITKGFGFLNKKEMINRCMEVFQRMKVNIDPCRPVGKLQAADKQLVEIAKALLFKCELIIMDEPTTALSTHEIENLFEIMRQQREKGVSFIYISHKIPELFEICESYYVLRDGRLVARGDFKDIDENGITELMIGRQLADDEFTKHVNSSREEIALSVRELSGEDFKNVSFELHDGEILAITGLHGSGRDSIADALYGVIPYKGEITIKGKPVKPGANIRSFLRQGVIMVPRMRKERGIHNHLSIRDNISMGYLNTKHKRPLINFKTENERFFRQKKALSIKTDQPGNPITSLSGGNQQKVILGRWLETDARVILFDNPTQGIDVGAKFEIYHLILSLAKEGKAIIIFSQEFPEIFKVADSCIVLYKGEINAVLGREELTEKNVMYYSTGANLEGEKYA
ncbi:MAG: sugar ABC transporter ATP-binding protein [Pseudomonadota bacterium]